MQSVETGNQNITIYPVSESRGKTNTTEKLLIEGTNELVNNALKGNETKAPTSKLKKAISQIDHMYQLDPLIPLIEMVQNHNEVNNKHTKKYLFQFRVVSPSLKNCNDKLFGMVKTDDLMREINNLAAKMFNGDQTEIFAKFNKGGYGITNIPTTKTATQSDWAYIQPKTAAFKKAAQKVFAEFINREIATNSTDDYSKSIALTEAIKAGISIVFGFTQLDLANLNKEDPAQDCLQTLMEVDLAANTAAHRNQNPIPKEGIERAPLQVFDFSQIINDIIHARTNLVIAYLNSDNKEPWDKLIMPKDKTKSFGIRPEIINMLRKADYKDTPLYLELIEHDPELESKLDLVRHYLSGINILDFLRPVPSDEFNFYSNRVQNIIELKKQLLATSKAPDSPARDSTISLLADEAQAQADLSLKSGPNQKFLTKQSYIKTLLDEANRDNTIAVIQTFADFIGIGSKNAEAFEATYIDIIDILINHANTLLPQEVEPECKSTLINFQISYSKIRKAITNENTTESVKAFSLKIASHFIEELTDRQFIQAIWKAATPELKVQVFDKLKASADEITKKFRKNIERTKILQEQTTYRPCYLAIGGDEAMYCTTASTEEQVNNLLYASRGIGQTTEARTFALVDFPQSYNTKTRSVEEVSRHIFNSQQIGESELGITKRLESTDKPRIGLPYIDQRKTRKVSC